LKAVRHAYVMLWLVLPAGLASANFHAVRTV